MCGLIGYASAASPLPLKAALAQLGHRGPDAQDVWEKSLGSEGRLGLGHARLSIVDLREVANQPLMSGCGRYRIIFNGEIYNHVELRQRLEAEGVVLATRSDTEVLLAGYIQWGVSVLERLDGMFAFCIHDMETDTLFLARDQFGIKPLYFHHDNARGVFAFSSEIRALVSLTGIEGGVDRTCLASFLLNGFLYEPETGVIGVQKLAPGSYLTYSPVSGAISTAVYHDILGDRSSSGEGFSELLAESTRLQSRADVPVGLFFSGGMDSTALAVSYPERLSALFIDYGADASGDLGIDRRYAGRIADKLGMPMEVVSRARASRTASGFIDEVKDVAAGTEEPISDLTFVAARDLAKSARERGFKVMLSGMGGDELLAGYPRHRLARFHGAARVASPIARALGATLSRHPRFAKKADRLSGFMSTKSFVEAYTRLVGYFSPDEVDAFLGAGAAATALDKIQRLSEPARGLSSLKRAMHLDLQGFLSHNLTVTDRASMAHGLEVRVPLLTPKLARWAFRQPDSALMGLRYGKKPLHALVRRQVGPELANRPKQGFNPPIDGDLSLIGEGKIVEVLKGGLLGDFIDLRPALDLVQRHFRGESNESYKIWQLFYLSFWLDSRAGFNNTIRKSAA